MNRRGFFGTVLGGFVAALMPAPKLPFTPKFYSVSIPMWINNPDWVLRVSNDETFSFGFSGFKSGDIVTTGNIRTQHFITGPMDPTTGDYPTRMVRL